MASGQSQRSQIINASLILDNTDSSTIVTVVIDELTCWCIGTSHAQVHSIICAVIFCGLWQMSAG